MYGIRYLVGRKLLHAVGFDTPEAADAYRAQQPGACVWWHTIRQADGSYKLLPGTGGSW